MNHKFGRCRRSAKRWYRRLDRRKCKASGYRRQGKRHYKKHGHGPP